MSFYDDLLIRNIFEILCTLKPKEEEKTIVMRLNKFVFLYSMQIYILAMFNSLANSITNLC